MNPVRKGASDLNAFHVENTLGLVYNYAHFVTQ
jgi:hypothetical protein